MRAKFVFSNDWIARFLISLTWFGTIKNTTTSSCASCTRSCDFKLTQASKTHANRKRHCIIEFLLSHCNCVSLILVMVYNCNQNHSCFSHMCTHACTWRSTLRWKRPYRFVFTFTSNLSIDLLSFCRAKPIRGCVNWLCTFLWIHFNPISHSGSGCRGSSTLKKCLYFYKTCCTFSSSSVVIVMEMLEWGIEWSDPTGQSPSPQSKLNLSCF